MSPSSTNDIVGPLAGLRVIDLTRVLSGPFCTMTLGDMGAEVLKIEHPLGGDDTRAFAPPYQGDQAAYFLSVNRNKKSICLDLKNEASKEVLWQLIETADILVENFRPGAAERLGFGYSAVSKKKPELIYASISGFGDSGPESDRPGYDLIVQGESGMMDITGPPQGAPHKMGTSIADMVAGMTLVQGILLALYSRNANGKGQHVKVSMLEALSGLLTYHASNYYATGKTSVRRGNAHPSIVPYETFKASDGWLNIAVGNDSQWEKFCEVLGRSDIRDDERFSTGPSRVENRDQLIPLLGELLLRNNREAWITELSAAGIPCGAIRSVAEICESETLKERGMLWEMQHPTAGPVRTIANPIELTGTPLGEPSPPPNLGEHSEWVLKEILEMSETEIETFKRAGGLGEM